MRDDDEEEFELIRPEDFLASNPIPPDARHLGFDRNTEGGAIIALAASLDPSKLSHRLMAWVMIFTFVVPTLLVLAREIF
jgi:hypothetical protein